MSGTRAISTKPRRELSSSFFFFLKGKAPKEIHAILTETLACFRPGRAKDLSAPHVQQLSTNMQSTALQEQGRLGNRKKCFCRSKRVEVYAQPNGLKFVTSQNCRYRIARQIPGAFRKTSLYFGRGEYRSL